MDASRALLGGLDGSGGTGRMRGPSPFSPRRRSVAPRISAAGACREWLSAEPALLPPRHAQSAWRGPRTRGAIGRIRAENGFRRAEPRGARREALAGESGAGQPEMGHVEGEGHAAEYEHRTAAGPSVINRKSRLGGYFVVLRKSMTVRVKPSVCHGLGSP